MINLFLQSFFFISTFLRCYSLRIMSVITLRSSHLNTQISENYKKSLNSGIFLILKTRDFKSHISVYLLIYKDNFGLKKLSRINQNYPFPTQNPWSQLYVIIQLSQPQIDLRGSSRTLTNIQRRYIKLFIFRVWWPMAPKYPLFTTYRESIRMSRITMRLEKLGQFEWMVKNCIGFYQFWTV